MVNDNSSDLDQDKPKPKIGPPTKYREEHCQLIIEGGKIGKGKAEMAADCGVDRFTFRKWCESIPELSAAFTRAIAFSAAWWESQGRLGIHSRDFNANAYSLQVRNRFPEDWQDKRELGLSAGQDFFDGLMNDEPERIDTGGEPDAIDIVATTVENDGEGQGSGEVE